MSNPGYSLCCCAVEVVDDMEPPNHFELNLHTIAPPETVSAANPVAEAKHVVKPVAETVVKPVAAQPAVVAEPPPPVAEIVVEEEVVVKAPEIVVEEEVVVATEPSPREPEMNRAERTMQRIRQQRSMRGAARGRLRDRDRQIGTLR